MLSYLNPIIDYRTYLFVQVAAIWRRRVPISLVYEAHSVYVFAANDVCDRK